MFLFFYFCKHPKASKKQNTGGGGECKRKTNHTNLFPSSLLDPLPPLLLYLTRFSTLSSRACTVSNFARASYASTEARAARPAKHAPCAMTRA